MDVLGSDRLSLVITSNEKSDPTDIAQDKLSKYNCADWEQI